MRLTGRQPMRAGVLAAVMIATLAGLAASGAQALASPGRAPRKPPASRPVALLTGITASHLRGYDQLVFHFAAAVPAHPRARYVTQVPAGAAGHFATVSGVTLEVSFARATGRGSAGQGTYGPQQRTFSLPGVIEVVTAADKGGTVTFAVGLARRERVRIAVLARLREVAIDVPTPYRTALARVFFVNTKAVFGTAVTSPVERPVPAPATPRAALQRLFAGPTQPEAGRSLQFVSSGATGFRLTYADGVAGVYLLGSCNSGGSTTNVTTEIIPTVRQFGWVRSVKIYDPSGRTEHPSGPGNSIPRCLQPLEDKVIATQIRGQVILALLGLGALGILIGLALGIGCIVAGLRARDIVITPAAFVAERVAAHPVGVGQFGPDSAWPLYPLRQIRADLRKIEAERRTRYGKLWHWPGPPLIRFIFFPVSGAAVLCLAVAGLTMLGLEWLFAAVTWACAAIVLLVFGAVLAVLTGVERLWHRVIRTEASCPRCYHVTARPAYRCPRCARLHRDIRPGRLGLLMRRCECGALLPTMVMRAAWRLEAVCQRCEEPLRPGSAAVRDVRIPIFGDTSAGKTRFMYAALDNLTATAGAAGIPLIFPDQESEQQATLALELIRSGKDTIKTSVTLPTALSCRIGKGASMTLVHMFDAAGEAYRSAEMYDSLGFLDNGHGLVYVLDPFSIGSVRDQLAGQAAAEIAVAHAAAGDPETAYGEVVSRLRDSGIAAGSQRLAVVVSKTDLLRRCGLDLPAESEAVAGWLSESGVHNLVLSARREFAEVRYFTVASLATDRAVAGHEPGEPLGWLLAAQGVRLTSGRDSAAPGPRVPHTRLAGDAEFAGPDQTETAKAQP
jgi:double-GTPase-like protein